MCDMEGFGAPLNLCDD